jgi:predicted dinucleotide-binding enzyme
MMGRLAGEVAFGCHISEKRAHASVVAAGRDTVTGKILVDLAPEFYVHPRDVVPLVAALAEKYDPVSVVVNPKSQSATLLKPFAEAGILVTELSAEDVVVAHAEFLDLVEATGLVQLNQPPLTAAMRASQQRPLAGAQAWDPKVDTDQSPLLAATWAVWGFRRWEELAQPGAWVL